MSRLPSPKFTKFAFEQLRNFVNCSLLFAAGEFASRQAGSVGGWLSDAAGWGVMGLALGLTLLNLIEGIREILSLPRRRGWIAVFIAAYLLACFRVLAVITAMKL